jgi:Zn finger protein HypA/HybF involved in hydrogenase expression
VSLDLDLEKITIACPQCSANFEETISRLKYEPKLSCPHCKHHLGVNLLELHIVLESVKKSRDDLLKKLVSRSNGKK